MSKRTNLQFLVGHDDSGNEVFGDFRRTGGFISTGHVGSGHASYDEAAFVTDLLQHYSPDELQFVMIDPKQVQLTPYEDIPYLWRPLAMTPDDVKSSVSDLLDEMQLRFDLLEQADAATIDEYNENAEEKLPYIILLATEIADLMMVDAKFYESAFKRFAQSAQVIGIHPYIATQRPSADVFTDSLLVNIYGRLIFATMNVGDCMRLLGGNYDAVNINEPGRLIFRDGTAEHRDIYVKTPLVTDEEVMKLVESITGGDE
jgi:S-DNA-T family DNA segregation ATPase FtsK/SpoIIIE